MVPTVIKQIDTEMKQLYYVIQTLLHSRGGNLIKVFSLGFGLAMSILLFSRLAYEESFDKCFPRYEELYQVWSVFTVNGEEYPPQEYNNGPAAGALLEHFTDDIESAVSLSKHRLNNTLYVGNVAFDNVGNVAADSLFFRTMGIEVLAGNPVEDLRQPDVIYLSESLARRMFDTEPVIGKVISIGREVDVTVKGIYRDVPLNSTMHPGSVTSLPTALSRNMGNYSWNGGDSWHAYVRLKPGTDPDELNRRIDAMVQQAVPQEAGYGLKLLVRPIRDTYRNNDDVSRMRGILSLLGVCILFVTSLNYVLISISSLSRRAKAIGVHKCSGAQSGTVFGMFLWETALIILMALCVTALLLLLFRDFVEDVAGYPLLALLAPVRLWVPLLVVSLLFLVGGVLPGRIFARIPVTQVFRRYTEGKKGWKRPLLFVQFGGVAFIGGLMCVTLLQYHHVLTEDPGYNPRRVALGLHASDSYEGVMAVKKYYESLPYVEEVACAMNNPFGYSGEMMFDAAGRPLFSAGYDYVTSNYVEMMGIHLLQGRLPARSGEVAVSQSMIGQMHWGDEVLGRMIQTEEAYIMGTGNGRCEVVGVIGDFTVGSFMQEQRPFVLHHHPTFGGCVHVRLKEPFAENLQRLKEDVKLAFPGENTNFYSMEQHMAEMYDTVRVFRNATIAATIVILFITLMGLVGYVNDETQRRSKEIAIRKVNGAEATTILSMLLRDVLLVAAPAVLVGVAGAWFVSNELMTMFITTFGSTIPGYLCTALAVLAVVAAIVLLRAWKIANENPVVSIKSE